MSNYIPVVTPLINSIGNTTGVTPSALFPVEIDVGSISCTTAFLFSTADPGFTTDLVIPPSIIQDVVSATIVVERISLLSNAVVTTPDYGGVDAGQLYRSLITIKPDRPLLGNTNYTALLTTGITPVTVYDAQHTVGTGTGLVLTKGVYTGLSTDLYAITIVANGSAGVATYTWTRVSDAFTSQVLTAKERYCDIDQGVKIKFGTGQFVSGDTYTVAVTPADFLNEYYNWTFSTGNTNYVVPVDNPSETSLDLPLIGNNPGVYAPTFYVTSITPTNATSCIPLRMKASLGIGQVPSPHGDTTWRDRWFDGTHWHNAPPRGIIGYTALNYGDEYNYWNITYIGGGTAGSEVVSLDGTAITIQIQAGVSTVLQIVTAFNASTLVNTLFQAYYDVANAAVPQTTQGPLYFDHGADDFGVTITFNTNVDPTTVTRESLQVIAENMVPGSNPDICRFTWTVVDNTINISFI